MNASTVDMNEVMRLTRAGRLLDATAFIQGRLGARRSSAAPPVPNVERHIDFERPASGIGAWRMPSAPEPKWEAPASRGEASRPKDVGRPLRARHVDPEPGLPPSARFEMRSVTNAAGTLGYKLYIPNGGGVQAPLVVMLHGCTQNPDDFAAGTRMNALAERHGFLVAYPAQTRAANPSRCWNWFKGSEQHRDRGEPSLIADATRQILAQHAIDRRRMYVAGLSAGGAAAAVMGCVYPDLYAGVGVHSGLACGAATDLPSALQAMRTGGGRNARPASRVPTIVFHGRADRTVGPSNADEVLDQVARSGQATVVRGTTAGGMPFVRTVRHAADGRPAGEQWMVDGAGHAWFGGDPKGSYTEPRGPDASREMLRFFGIISD